MIEDNQNDIMDDEILDEDDEFEKAYRACMYSKLQRSIADFEAGRVMTLEESMERLRRKYPNFNVE